MTTTVKAMASGLGVLLLTLALALPLVPAATAADGEGAATPTAGSRVTLGLRHHTPPSGTGWGRVAPRTISNGGVPSGTVQHLRWRKWGSSAAFGRGLTAAYLPEGGYYADPVRIRMKATRVRSCGGHRAYTVLRFKAQRRPGGPMPRRWSTWTTQMCRPWAYYR